MRRTPAKSGACIIQGENPAMSDPDLDHARAGLAKLEHHGGAGYLPDRDGDDGRRDPAVLGVAGEVRHGDQHQPAGADGPQGAAAARRHARGSVDPGRARQASRPDLDLQPSVRSVRRDEACHALARQHHLGAARAGILGDLSLPRAGSSRRSGGVRRRLPHPYGARSVGTGRCLAAGRGARRRISAGIDDRAATGALAYWCHDAPRRCARCARAWTDGEPQPEGTCPLSASSRASRSG